MAWASLSVVASRLLRRLEQPERWYLPPVRVVYTVMSFCCLVAGGGDGTATGGDGAVS